jgi:hypothetical protein
MFNQLGINWGCTLITFLSLGVSIIPFAFIYFGGSIRKNSRFCQHLQQLKEEERRAWEQDLVNGDPGDCEKGMSSTAASSLDRSQSVGATEKSIIDDIERHAE